MNDDIFKGYFHELKGKLKHQWAELTDDELQAIEADHEAIFGILQKHYGYTKEQIKSSLTSLVAGIADKAHNAKNEISDLKQEFSRLGDQFQSGLKALSEKIKQGTATSQEATRTAVQNHPLTALGVAAGLGLLLGYVLKKN